jgi:hypothetical protein
MQAKFENIIRSFGMSGFQITNDICDIEKSFDLEFGHTPTNRAAQEQDYYPQFEQEVRAEASEMAAHYEAFYCLEKSIRKLITETMAEVAGEQWWSAGRINAMVTQEVASRIQREVDSGVTRRSMDNLDYTTFGELTVIITANWDLFGSIFSSRKAVERVLSNLNTLRGPIAHCSRLFEDEVIRLRLTVRDWFRTMQ